MKVLFRSEICTIPATRAICEISFSMIFVLVFISASLFGSEKPSPVEFFPLELSNPTVQTAPPFLETEVETASETRENADEDETVPLENFQDYWKMRDVSDSMRDNYEDGSVWRAGEENLLFLFHLHEYIRLERMESWALPDTALDALDTLTHSELNPRRFDAFHVFGRLLSFEKTTLEESVAFRYRISEYYTCKLVLDDGRNVTLFCEKIPRALLKPDALKNPPRVGIYALFMKKGPTEENVRLSSTSVDDTAPRELASMYLLGSRLAWYPDTILGNAGMDYGLFDDLDREELPEDALRSAAVDTRLTLRNRECFYQLLAAANRFSDEKFQQIISDIRKNAPDSYFEQIPASSQEIKSGQKAPRFSSVIPLFQQPARERGNFFLVRGVARRILPIRVEDEDIQNRFGIQHYYEIFLFPDETPESPIVVIVPELPPDVAPGNDMGYYVELSVPAFFFNTWSYQKGTNEEGKPLRRLAPLLIGGVPSRTISTVYTPDLGHFYVLGLFVFGMLFLFSTVYYFVNRREEKECNRNRMKMFSIPAGTHYDEVVKQFPEKHEMDFDEWCKKNE